MGRSELREHIFRILFRIEFQSKEEMEEQLALYFADIENLEEKDKEYISKKYMNMKHSETALDDAFIAG